ncbi:hypothetical protein [Alterinioella nitratireducens]|uniref:hypothetical protein n=1 Tax=Alterinioella nitratireducens TaxID=2735915 RepID=UPI004058584C
MRNKNIPSNNPEYRKRKRVEKEFTALLHSEGHGVLFTTGTNALPEKKRARQNLRRTKLILDAIKYNMWVPQSMRDEVNRPPDENPRAPDEDDDGKAPF